MKRIDNANQLVFHSFDDRGVFEFGVHRSGRQIQLLRVEMGTFGRETLIDTDLKEIRAIRDMLSEVLKINQQKNKTLNTIK